MWLFNNERVRVGLLVLFDSLWHSLSLILLNLILVSKKLVAHLDSSRRWILTSL